MYDQATRDKAVDQFYHAVREGDEVLARRLVAEWPEFAQIPELLIQAIQYRRISVVADFLAAGADPNELDELDVSPLDVAVQCGDAEITRMLIDVGAVGPVDDAGAVAQEKVAERGFLEAVATGEIEAVRHFLAECPFLLQATEALNLAVEFGHAEILTVLLGAAGLIGTGKDRDGSPLATAAAFGRLEIARMLLDAGAGDHDGAAIRAAAASGNEAMTALLIRSGLDINARDRHGQTALWEAASSRNPSVVRLLLAEGAEVDARDSFFVMTPLIRAARAENLEMVTALLEAGADPRATDRAGLSAWDYAEHSNQPDLRALLLRFDPSGM